MLRPQIKQCQDCNSLKELLVQVGCSLTNLLKNKLNNENYNVETYYCSKTATALGHYKRILTRKIYNPTYLCDIEGQDIVYQVKKLLFGTCANCIPCEEDVATSTTTFTTTTNIL